MVPQPPTQVEDHCGEAGTSLFLVCRGQPCHLALPASAVLQVVSGTTLPESAVELRALTGVQQEPGPTWGLRVRAGSRELTVRGMGELSTLEVEREQLLPLLRNEFPGRMNHLGARFSAVVLMGAEYAAVWDAENAMALSYAEQGSCEAFGSGEEE